MAEETAPQSPNVTPTPVDAAALARAQAKVDDDRAHTLTDKEQTALDAQAALDRAVRGYDTFLYHGVTMFRINEAPDTTFETEADAQRYVAAMRVQRNLS